MRWRRAARSESAPGRRSGPADEERWWDPVDQAVAEGDVLSAIDLGRGWVDVAMPGNAERLDPLADDAASEAVRDARRRRRLTALDEGRAWRQRTVGSLAVLRVELFEIADDQEHRQAWRRHAEASLVATWRARWEERGRVAGWIEARPVDAPSDAVDWFRIEDHTDPTGGGAVTVYEHVTVWAGRRHAALTVRHELGLDVDAETASATAALHRRLTSP